MKAKLGLFRNTLAQRKKQTVMQREQYTEPEIDTIFPLRIQEHFATNPLRTAIATRFSTHTHCHRAKIPPGKAEAQSTQGDETQRKKRKDSEGLPVLPPPIK